MEEPATKRPRLQQQQQPQPEQQQPADTEPPPAPALTRPSITSLFLIPAGLPREPSPGAMHGCRIAAHAIPGRPLAYASAFASGASVFWSQVALQQQALPEAGKEGVMLPLRLQAPPAVLLQELRHVSEVQALALAPAATTGDEQQLLLATVDAFGQGTISRLRLASSFGAAQAAAAAAGDVGSSSGPVQPEVACQARLSPLDGCCEGGWAGVAFSSSSSSDAAEAFSSGSSAGLLVATARGFDKALSLHDAATGAAVRSFGCALHPHALAFLPPGAGSSSGGGAGSNVLAVAEGHMLSLWDVRHQGGCVQRVAAGTPGNALYALDWCPAQGGLLGAAGAERSVFLAELRKLRVVAKWHGAARQAVHSLAFLQADPRFCVLGGLDLEVLCGRWDKPGGGSGSSSGSRAFQSAAAPGDDEQPAAAVAAAAAAAPGAPGSGDRTRGGASAAAAAAGGGGGAGADGAVAQGSGGFSFRGDARWLGVSRAAGADVFAGLAASGSLVYARIGCVDE